METKLIKYLQSLPLFKETPEAVLAKIVGRVEIRNLSKDAVLVHRGDPSDSLFIIRTGWVKIVADGLIDEEVVLNQCGPGQVIGEMSLIDQTPRSNTVIAMTQTQMLEIKYGLVLEILNEHPILAISFLRDLSDRVRFANAYIEETIIWSEQIAAGNYDFVQKQVEQSQSTIIGMNLSHQARANAFLSSFFKMIEGVKKREEDLKRQLQLLTIEIDETKRQRAVQELTENEFFENLQVAAEKFRQERKIKERKRRR